MKTSFLRGCNLRWLQRHQLNLPWPFRIFYRVTSASGLEKARTSKRLVGWFQPKKNSQIGSCRENDHNEHLKPPTKREDFFQTLPRTESFLLGGLLKKKELSFQNPVDSNASGASWLLSGYGYSSPTICGWSSSNFREISRMILGRKHHTPSICQKSTFQKVALFVFNPKNPGDYNCFFWS